MSDPVPTTTAPSERGRYAAFRRSRPADDPDLLEARRRMREEALVAAVMRALNKSSVVVTAELRARIDTLLADRQVGA
jgi:hypothetical protein